MIIATIGFTQKTAKEFFELLINNNVELLIDVRLNNKSQLAGFTKGNDLGYFLDKICGIKYVHDTMLAPAERILSDYKKKVITWEQYILLFKTLLNERNIDAYFAENYTNTAKVVCLLCSEPTSQQCHRKIVAEYIKDCNPVGSIIIKDL